jgi:phosphopantetheinyl transferase
VTTVGTTDVWYRDTRSLNPEAIGADQYLSADERARRDRFHFEHDRRDYAIAHDLLRRRLSGHADVPPGSWRFAADGNGKPWIESDDPRQRLSFSLAHTRGCVACAITPAARLGVDVERVERASNPHDVADRFFSDEESAALRACPSDARPIRFVELWTLKEAFLKAVGTGLAGSLRAVSFRFDDRDGFHCAGLPSGCPQDWQFALYEPYGGIRLAVAVEGHHVVTVRDDGTGAALAPIRATR